MSGSNTTKQTPGGPVNIGGNISTDKNTSVGNGATGTFATVDKKIVTVTDGIVTNIS